MAHGEIHVELSVNYADDPKVAALARFGRDARPARDLYVQMICYSKANLTDGYVPSENMGKLVYPDSPRAAVRQAEMLAEVGLINTAIGGWTIAAYLRRNKSRAEVLELSQIRAEAGRQGGKRSGLSRSSQANAKQVASVGLNTETETQSETTSLPRKRGTRITEDWKPPPTEVAWRRENGIGDHLAQREHPKFVNYWLAKSGRDGAKLDWLATWRNWLLNAQEREPTTANAAVRTRPDGWEFGA